MVNKVTLIGNVGQDPEERDVNNAKVVNFSLATSEKYKDRSGESVVETQWHTIVCWRKTAENAALYIRKGQRVYVEGKITYRKYTDKNGVERKVTDIVCNFFRIVKDTDQDRPASTSFQNVTHLPEPAPATSGEDGDDLPF